MFIRKRKNGSIKVNSFSFHLSEFVIEQTISAIRAILTKTNLRDENRKNNRVILQDKDPIKSMLSERKNLSGKSPP